MRVNCKTGSDVFTEKLSSEREYVRCFELWTFCAEARLGLVDAYETPWCCSVAQILSQTGLPLCTTDAEWTTTEHFISTARVRLEGWQEGPLKAHTHLVPRALKTAVSDLLTALKRGGTNAKLSGTPNQVAAMR